MDKILEALPIQFIFDPSQRLYWPFLLSAALMAYFYTAWTQRGTSASRKWKQLKKLVLSPSSQLDIKLMFLNTGLKIFVFPLVAISSFSISLAVLKGLRVLWPMFQGLDTNPLTTSLIAALMAFVIDDFLRFFQHALSHTWGPMRQLHRTHHSATVLTPLTFFRSHPLESFISGFRNSLGLGLTLGLYSFLFQGVVSGLDILGVNALGFLFNATFSNLRHSQIPLSFGALEAVFISPRMHQIHHSNDPKHFNKNFGVALTLWDFIWGSYYRPSAQEMRHIRYGFCTETQESYELKAALTAPFPKLTTPSFLKNKVVIQKGV